MIDMGMGENDSIQIFRRSRKRLPVSLSQSPPSLKKPAVDQQTFPVDLQKKAGSGYRLSRT